MSALSFTYLSQEDMIEAGVLDMHKCVETIEKVFKLLANGDYIMGGPSENAHGIGWTWPEKPRGPRMPLPGPARRFMAMIAYVGGEFHIAGVKWYGSNVENPIKNQWPRSIHFVILNDAEFGYPIAVMDGTLISAMRTGAVPGVGAKYLARKDSEIVGLIGAGLIHKPVLMALADVLPNIKEVKIFDLRRSQSEKFSKEMGEELGLDINPVDSTEEAVKNCDVIDVATAGPKNPTIKSEWLKEGSYLALTSGISESDDVFLTSKIVIDNLKMHKTWRKEWKEKGKSLSGLHNLITEGRIKEENIKELGYIVNGSQHGRVDEEEKILLQTGGMPIEDVAWGYTVYKEAIKKNIGRKLNLWKKPNWF